MQHRGAHAGKGCTGDVHAGGAEQACTAGNNGREQIGRAAQGAGRRARWAAAAWEDAHAGGKRERARAGGSLQVLSARNQGGSGVYIGMERGFLACVPREESGCGSGCREKKNGPSCWFGPKRFFLISFLQKNSTNSI